MNIGGYIFSGPYSPYKGFTVTISGVYAILDEHNVVIDVGQTSNMNNRFPGHDRQSQWEVLTSNPGLYILRVAGEQRRLFIESTLRQTYKPSCGVR